jgi:hypothetical protein
VSEQEKPLPPVSAPSVLTHPAVLWVLRWQDPTDPRRTGSEAFEDEVACRVFSGGLPAEMITSQPAAYLDVALMKQVEDKARAIGFREGDGSAYELSRDLTKAIAAFRFEIATLKMPPGQEAVVGRLCQAFERVEAVARWSESLPKRLAQAEQSLARAESALRIAMALLPQDPPLPSPPPSRTDPA